MLPVQYQRRQGEDRRRARIARSPATRRSAMGLVAAGQLAEQARSSTPATRSRRPATSCTSSPSMKHFGVKTFQAEDEIAAIGVAIGASFGGAHRRHRHQRPRHLPEERGDRPGGHDRAAAGHHRRAARRPEHRPADQDRAGRPAAGDVRPQRRVPGRDRRPAVAGRLLRHGHRGGPHRRRGS